MLVAHYIEKDLKIWTDLIKQELKKKGIKISFFVSKSEVSQWWWSKICANSNDRAVTNETLWRIYDTAIEIGLAIPPPTDRRDDVAK